jgi:hypothetical protein
MGNLVKSRNILARIERLIIQSPTTFLITMAPIPTPMAQAMQVLE